MKNKFFVVVAIINIVICMVAYAREVNSELSQTLLRMHIIANSDSEYDQRIKLDVRDELIKVFKDDKYKSREDVIKNLKTAQKSINLFLNSKNVEYSCVVSYSKSKFPKKDYENISMPAGEYECVRVVLGEGKGKNWWCIAYPPLCFTDSSVGTDDGHIKDLLTEDTYEVITSGESEYKIKFKIVDIINELCNLL